MARGTTTNRFTGAGQALVGSENSQQEKKSIYNAPKRKDKVITAKVYPETWASFTAINKTLGMTNNSVINMLISNYVHEKKNLID